MPVIKEITVFTLGNSNELKTWSHVPYFFTKSLQEKGIKINRVNIEENKLLSSLYKYSVYALLKLVYPKTAHNYFRSFINNTLTKRKITKALAQYPQANVNLFLTYSFSIKQKTNQKTVLFSDWSYLYKIQELENRQAYWFEKGALKREAEHLNTADSVFSLFPKSQLFLQQHFNNTSTYYLGNVINCDKEVDKEIAVQTKLKSRTVLFIGNKKYLQGALDLIDACKAFNSKQSKPIQLHIIGLTNDDLNIHDSTIFCYGYLDKGKKDEADLYYTLLVEARAVINTTKNWGGFSAMTEAMYYYTPVITTPYDEFIETYGKNISFGFYATNLNELEDGIEKLFSVNELQYIQWMNSAHDAVKDFTWNSYTQKVLDKITQ